MRGGLIGAFLISSAVLVTGCTGHFQRDFGTTPPAPGRIGEHIRGELSSIRQFTGEATLTIDSPEQSGRVGSRIAIKPEEQAEITLQSPFGGVVGRMTLSPELFMLYNRTGNLEYVGSPERPGLPGFPDLSGEEDHLLQILMGLVSPPDSRELKMNTPAESGQYIFTNHKNGRTAKYRIDPRIGRVTQYTVGTASASDSLVVTFSHFTRVDGIHFPKSIQVIQPLQKRMFSIFYHEIQIQRQERSHVIQF